MMNPSFTYHRYQFNCRTLDSLPLNFYSGSMLRGAFGWALKKVSCATKMDDCQRCLLYRQCHYPKIFEPPVPSHTQLKNLSRIPAPYVIEPPQLGQKTLAKNDTFSFQLILMGPAIALLPTIVSAWQLALKTGLGKSHSRAELLSVVFEPGQKVEQIIPMDDLKQNACPMPTFTPKQPDNNISALTIKLQTPLSIKRQGKLLAQTMTGRDFILALIRRYYLLQEFYTSDYQPPDFSRLVAQAELIQAKPQLSLCHLNRYSNRQQQEMTFQGVMGDILLTGEIKPFLPLLFSGQWWHVGSKTSFGMGRYQITPLLQ